MGRASIFNYILGTICIILCAFPLHHAPFKCVAGVAGNGDSDVEEKCWMTAWTSLFFDLLICYILDMCPYPLIYQPCTDGADPWAAALARLAITHGPIGDPLADPPLVLAYHPLFLFSSTLSHPLSILAILPPSCTHHTRPRTVTRCWFISAMRE